MYKYTKVAVCVATFFSGYSIAFADETSSQLPLISVEANIQDTSNGVIIKHKEIERKQPRNIKDMLSELLDVDVTNLQTTHSGNDGVNIRGLSANRVSTTIDGIQLPEAQEAKHFISYGMEFGRGDYIEPTALRSTEINYSGSSQTLSSGINFSTLNPQDLLKGNKHGGFVGTGYDSVDHSVYSSIGAAIQEGRYQGMIMSTLRHGHETKTHGNNTGTGTSRTEADPAKYNNIYVLTKHEYQIDDANKLKFIYEHQYKKTDTTLLSKTGTSIDSGSGTQLYGAQTDRVKRDRFSLEHEYNNDSGWIQNIKTQVYYQDASTENSRFRQGSKNYRSENAKVNTKAYGLNSDFLTTFDGQIPQALRYGFGYNYTKADNYLRYTRPAYSRFPYSLLGSSSFDGKPSSDTVQQKFNFYVEDEIALGSLVITPHLDILHYRVSPKTNSNVITGFKAEKTKQTFLTPKLSLNWMIAPEFEPYFRYSQGVRTPSPQQLTSFFNESPMGYSVAVVGNPHLKAETAHNFELGLQGKTNTIQYHLSGYYNRYRNFIDWKDITNTMSDYTQFLQYQNFATATIYGVTAHMKWNFYTNFYSDVGIAYAHGSKMMDGNKTPINSIQPLKTRLGLGYDNDTFGANIHWTYVKGKADKDISGTMYNPTGGYSVWDLGTYWKPTPNLTLTANLNNVFNKKYWNWNDISYLALLTDSKAKTTALSINSTNADRYSAPGRNVNLGIRYEF